MASIDTSGSPATLSPHDSLALDQMKQHPGTGQPTENAPADPASPPTVDNSSNQPPQTDGGTVVNGTPNFAA